MIRPDVYKRVTDRIISDLKQEVRPWQKPWNAEYTEGRIIRPLRHNGTPYRGVNVLLLWIEALAQGFASPTWMTFKQANALGAHIRKGEHGGLVVYADRYTKTKTDGTGEQMEEEIPFMKGYTVFNVEQIDGLPEQYHIKPAEPPEPVIRIEHAEAFFAATGAVVRHGGNRAFYAPGADRIQVPPRESFINSESYCATLAHELTHWTAHPSRLARELSKRFGDNRYAAEELIAEVGAAFLCADLAITPEVQPGHAQYLYHWLKILKSDSRAIFTAAAQAQRAADFLHDLQPKPELKPVAPDPATRTRKVWEVGGAFSPS